MGVRCQGAAAAHRLLRASHSSASNLYDSVYNLGIYAQDEWRVKPNLVLDYGIRVDRNGNPACVNNCYNHYIGGFPVHFLGNRPVTSL